MFYLMLIFIVAVEIFDTAFAYHFRESFILWELNPVARWLYVKMGIAGIIGAKAIMVVGGLAFLLFLRRYDAGAVFRGTVILTVIHAILAGWYLFGVF